MASKILLVQGDSRPQLIFSVTDQNTGQPANLSDTGTTILMKFREAGDDALKAILPVYKLTGRLLEGGSISYEAPYDVEGAGGRLYMDWTQAALDTAGLFEAELEITYSDGQIQTVYDILKFKIREQF